MFKTFLKLDLIELKKLTTSSILRALIFVVTSVVVFQSTVIFLIREEYGGVTKQEFRALHPEKFKKSTKN